MKNENMSNKDSFAALLLTYKKEKLHFLLAFLLLFSLISKMRGQKDDVSVVNNVNDDTLSADVPAFDGDFSEQLTQLKLPDDKITESTSMAYDYVSNIVKQNAEARLQEVMYYDSVYDLMVRERLTPEKLELLLNSMIDGPFDFFFTSQEDALDFLLNANEYSTQLKMLIVMARDGYTYEELDTVCAGCVGEGAGAGTIDIDDRGVASTLVNRIHDSVFVASHGTSLYKQFKAPGQFSVYSTTDENVSYKQYLGRIDLVGYQAAVDVFYTEETNHDCLFFKAWWVDLGDKPYIQFLPNGNKYHDERDISKVIPTPEFVLERDAVMQLTLTMFD